MGPGRGPLLASAVGIALLVPSVPARAWTETEVRSVRAEVQIQRDGRAHVVLELEVYVHRGWLEGLEVAGLDPGLKLDPQQPAWWLPADGDVPFDEAPFGPKATGGQPGQAVPGGEVTDAPATDVVPASTNEHMFVPDMHVSRNGRVQFRFDRAHAPRHGTYRAGFAFTTRMQVGAAGHGRVQLGWTLPGWRTGLDDVTVVVIAPAGARAVTRWSGAPSPVQVARTQDGDRTRLSFRRPHLPRTVPWTVAVDVPAGALDPAVRPDRQGTSALLIASPDGKSPPAEPTAPLWALAALLWTVAVAKLAAFGLRCRAARLHRKPLVPLPAVLRGLACCAAAAVGVWAWAREPAVGFASFGLLPLLVAERPPQPTSPRFGAFRRAGAADLVRARRAVLAHAVTGPAALDLGSWSGAIVLAAGAAAVAWVDHLHPTAATGLWTPVHALVLLLPLGFAAGSRSLPAAASVRLWKLARLARSVRFDLPCGVPLGLELVVHEDGEGRWQDARLRCVLPGAPPGLVRLDLGLADRPELGELALEPVLIAVTREGSMADALVRDAVRWHQLLRAPGKHVARIAPVHEQPGEVAMRAARALTAWSLGGAPITSISERAVA